MIGDCEMTGKRGVQLFRIKIDGAFMNVCKECVKFGEKIDKPQSFKTSKGSFNRVDKNANKFIIKAYASAIKKARESKNLKQSEMADKLNEKESLIHKIESGHLKPNFPLAKKLERFLGISLFETISETQSTTTTSSSKKGEPLTMEAMILAAMKKKK
jgi:putative transcription factor